MSEYTPTVWRTGDVITAEKLNKIEEGIANAESGGGELSNDLQTVTIPALTLTGEYSEMSGGYITTTKVADAVEGVDPLIDYNEARTYKWFVRNNDGNILPEAYKNIDGVDVILEVYEGEILLETIGSEAYTIQVPSDTLIFYIATEYLVNLYGISPFSEVK